MKDLKVNFENLTKEQQEQLLSLVEKSQEVKDPMEFEIGEGYHVVGNIGGIGGRVKVSEKGFFESFDFGNVYRTKEQAETASKAMRRFNRILQFAILHDGLVESGWGFLVCLSGTDGELIIDFEAKAERVLDSVVMTKECAELLCEKYNSGEYTL